MIEVWKAIDEYKGLYEISNLGRLKSLPRNGTVNRARITKGHLDKDGYKQMYLSKNNIVESFRSHRLVAFAFIPNIENKPHVDHINGIKTDNRAKNLRWVTPKENVNNPITKVKLAGRKKSLETRKKMSRQARRDKNSNASKVNQFTKDYKFIKRWDCMADIKEELGIIHSSISNCCIKNMEYKNNNIDKKSYAKGFIWEYAE